MTKPYKHTDLSNKLCKCGKRLKLNLLAKKPNADKCYKCHKKNHCAKARDWQLSACGIKV